MVAQIDFSNNYGVTFQFTCGHLIEIFYLFYDLKNFSPHGFSLEFGAVLWFLLA